MKKYCVSILILSLLLLSACTQKPKLEFDGFYKFKLPASYKECIDILKDNKLDYTVKEIHDDNGNGVAIRIDNVIKINDKGAYLILHFPDIAILKDKYVNYHSRVLLSFTYGVKDIDLEYAKGFVQFFTKYLGEPDMNQFEEEYSKDFDAKCVSWVNDYYSINCVAILQQDVSNINIYFSMTDEQRFAFERKQF